MDKPNTSLQDKSHGTGHPSDEDANHRKPPMDGKPEPENMDDDEGGN